MMDVAGLVMLALAPVIILVSGQPVYLVLSCLACCGAAFGIASGGVSFEVFASLPSRLLNLLESDILQALPLFVAIGVMLERLPLIDSLYKSLRVMFGAGYKADLATAMTIGGLLGPMNGSVGANVLGLCRSVFPRLVRHGVPHAEAQGVICVASTLGVVVPPSLVLILLGDAMLNAHTVALQGTARTDRIINTQDIFQGALVPALVLLGGFVILALWQGWRTPSRPAQAVDHMPGGSRLTMHEALTALVLLGVLLILLYGVATGSFYAVEAAATGAALLLVYGWLNGHWSLEVARDCLHDAAAASGAIFALLVGATSFTLVLRLFGTDKLIAQWLLGLDLSSALFLCLVLVLVMISALVLDAFEIIFVIIPILAPPLLMRVEDATWAAVSLLLTLQLAFVVPPVGYALMMTRSAVKQAVPLADIVRAMRPYVLWQVAVLVCVLVWPQSVHLFDAPDRHKRGLAEPLSKDTVQQQIQHQMPQIRMPQIPVLPTR